MEPNKGLFNRSFMGKMSQEQPGSEPPEPEETREGAGLLVGLCLHPQEALEGPGVTDFGQAPPQLLIPTEQGHEG